MHAHMTTLSACLIEGSSTLEVTVYGFGDSGDTVGQLLSQQQLYLQEPEFYNSYVPYINPQVLLPPGSRFETWYASVRTEDSTEAENRATQDLAAKPATKSRINEILDGASGPTKFSEVQVSNRIESKLKP
jgi:hypothetical protein